VRGQLPVSPARSSLHATDRVPRGLSSSGSNNGRFFSTRQPTAVNRVPFEQQRSRTEQTFRGSSSGASPYGGGWRPATASSQVPPAASNRVNPATGPSAASNTAGSGWRRFEPNGNAGGAYQQPGAQSGNGMERQPMRMNPAIVQPRPGYGYPPQPSYRPASGPAPSSGGGSARPSAPAPSSSGGRSSSGGGGGGHSSGGGGHSGGHGR